MGNLRLRPHLQFSVSAYFCGEVLVSHNLRDVMSQALHLVMTTTHNLGTKARSLGTRNAQTLRKLLRSAK